MRCLRLLPFLRPRRRPGPILPMDPVDAQLLDRQRRERAARGIEAPRDG